MGHSSPTPVSHIIDKNFLAKRKESFIAMTAEVTYTCRTIDPSTDMRYAPPITNTPTVHAEIGKSNILTCN